MVHDPSFRATPFAASMSAINTKLYRPSSPFHSLCVSYSVCTRRMPGWQLERCRWLPNSDSEESKSEVTGTGDATVDVLQTCSAPTGELIMYIVTWLWPEMFPKL